jgi:hypothetical protein
VLTVYHRPEAVEADIKQAFEVYGLPQCFEQWRAQCL